MNSLPFHIADFVDGFEVEFDQRRSVFHVTFDVTTKKRSMWVPASIAVQVGLLPAGWKTSSNIKALLVEQTRLDESPIVISAGTEQTDKGGVLLKPSAHSGKITNLLFNRQTWIDLATALARQG